MVDNIGNPTGYPVNKLGKGDYAICIGYMLQSARGEYIAQNACIRSIVRVASGVSNIIDHTLTKRPIIDQFFSSTVPVSPVKFFTNTIETDNLKIRKSTDFKGDR